MKLALDFTLTGRKAWAGLAGAVLLVGGLWIGAVVLHPGAALLALLAAQVARCCSFNGRALF